MGYGWGPPTCWQGWVVIAAFVVLQSVGALFLLPDKHGAFLACMTVLLTGFIGICRWKGESPSWRWVPPSPLFSSKIDKTRPDPF